MLQQRAQREGGFLLRLLTCCTTGMSAAVWATPRGSSFPQKAHNSPLSELSTRPHIRTAFCPSSSSFHLLPQPHRSSLSCCCCWYSFPPQLAALPQMCPNRHREDRNSQQMQKIARAARRSFCRCGKHEQMIKNALEIGKCFWHPKHTFLGKSLPG